MDTLVEIAEKVERLMEAGQSSDEGLLDHLYTYSVIHDARAAVLREDFIKFKRWSPSAIQVYYPEYDVNYQNSNVYTRFRIPTGFIQGNVVGDGLVYFGSDATCIYGSQNFDRIKNRAELNDFLNNSRTNDFSTPAIFIEGLNVTVLSKSNLVETLQVYGVFENPSLVEPYSIERDPYPASQDMMVRIMEVIEKRTMQRVYSRPADALSDSSANLKK